MISVIKTEKGSFSSQLIFLKPTQNHCYKLSFNFHEGILFLHLSCVSLCVLSSVPSPIRLRCEDHPSAHNEGLSRTDSCCRWLMGHRTPHIRTKKKLEGCCKHSLLTMGRHFNSLSGKHTGRIDLLLCSRSHHGTTTTSLTGHCSAQGFTVYNILSNDWLGFLIRVTKQWQFGISAEIKQHQEENCNVLMS